MGIFLTFYSNFQHISQQEWEEAYDKTLEALQHCVIPIVRFKKETVLSEERYVWTHTFWHEKEKNWEIGGDAMTLNYAERFSLHRNIQHYINSGKEKFSESVFLLRRFRL